MKFTVDFEFAFSADDRNHSMILDLADPAHAKLVQYVGTSPSVDELEDELDHYLQYDLIMPKTQIVNIARYPDRLEYDLELELDGVQFTNHETLPFEWTEDGSGPGINEDLEAYLAEYFSGTHHNFDVLDLTIKPLSN